MKKLKLTLAYLILIQVAPVISAVLSAKGHGLEGFVWAHGIQVAVALVFWALFILDEEYDIFSK